MLMTSASTSTACITPAMSASNVPVPNTLRTLAAHSLASGATDAMPSPLVVTWLATKVPWKL